MADEGENADTKPTGEVDDAAKGGGGEGETAAAEDDVENNGLVICAIITIVILMVLAVFDSMTTHFFKRGCIALADWTMENAPASFIIFEVVIIVFIVCCLPYGPLSLLSGALFYQKYGSAGVIMAWIALFIGTFPSTLGAIERVQLPLTVFPAVFMNAPPQYLISLKTREKHRRQEKFLGFKYVWVMISLDLFSSSFQITGTFVAFSICFGLGRYYLRQTVEKQVNKKPSVRLPFFSKNNTFIIPCLLMRK